MQSLSNSIPLLESIATLNLVAEQMLLLNDVSNGQLSTTMITSGTVGYTSTLNTTSSGVTSSYVVVDVPVLSTTTTYGGSKTLTTNRQRILQRRRRNDLRFQ